MQRARKAGLLDRLRIRMGLPLEFYLQAVYPVIETYAAHIDALPAIENTHAVAPVDVLMEGLELAVIALDFRRGRILPPHAAPEDIGERAHRWTYAVFVAAMLHRVSISGGPGARRHGLSPAHTAAPAVAGPAGNIAGPSAALATGSLLLFRRMVPPAIQAWLGADNALLWELQGLLLGEAVARRGALCLLMRQAEDEFLRVRGAGTVAPLPQQAEAGRLPIDDNGERKLMPASGAALHVPEGPEGNPAKRFMDWVSAGIRDGSIPINAAGAPVHFVHEGMLLVSPRIFRDFAQRFGEDGSGTVPTDTGDESGLGKVIQRQVLRAGWHRKAVLGNNIQTYDVIRNGRPVSGLSGVLIVQPQRFVNPLPPVNPVLVPQAPV